ncbi:MAG: biotin-dependent carboxyltransferase [Gemmatimonadetes bacterium]|nr:biotin-dependent carboxyltransferase [Gemmatimonadota bacterium]
MKVLKPGLLTTVQDLGRHGYQRDGVSVGGAMDAQALRVANLLVGNPENAAGLEFTLLGPTLEFTGDTLFAVTGGHMSPRIGDRSVPEARPVLARAGATLSFKECVSGARGYLAFAGGFDVPEVLGSRGTHLRAGFGGLDGRALRAGDTLRLAPRSDSAERVLQSLAHRPGTFVATPWSVSASALPRYAASPTVRVIPGIHFARFDDANRRAFFQDGFRITPQSDRMGYRLEGPLLSLIEPLEPISEPVCAGTIQVPPEGQAIVLMADRQSAGGYPRIGQVITVDLPLIAQTKAGDTLRFSEVSLEQAEELYVERERTIEQVRQGLLHAPH